MRLQDALARVVQGSALSESEMAAVMERILAGNASPAQIGALLMALRMKGETVGELVGAARAMRAHAVPIPGVPAGAVDTCGTGGDGASTLNVSTAAGLVVAGAGVPVAKHGNRAVSGAVGGADVLEALGVRLELPAAVLGACLGTTGFVFLHAPALQPAMRHAAGPRRELGVRTLFNVLGPLTNPAGVRRQVIGVFDRRWVEPVAEVAEGRVRLGTVTAADAGLAPAPLAALRVGSTAEAAALLGAVLEGTPGPARDVVCLNAAAALVVAGAARDLHEGVGLASASIDSGAATRVLERVVEFTRRQADAGAA